MLPISSQHKLLVAVEPVDFRRGIDGLRALCLRQWQVDPLSGQVFVFRNKRSTSVKLLTYDGNGFWLCQKRFSQGKLAWWPKDSSKAVALRASEFQILLAQGDPMKAAIPQDWRPLQIDHAADAKTDNRLS